MSTPLNKLQFLGTAPVNEFGFATGSFLTWTVLETELRTELGTELGTEPGTELETVIGTGIGTGLGAWLGTGLATGVGAPKAGKSRCPNEGWGVDLWTAFDLEIN